jgi:hypothetical protein
VIDTTDDSVTQVADNVATWIEEERALYASGRHALAAWARDLREAS